MLPTKLSYHTVDTDWLNASPTKENREDTNFKLLTFPRNEYLPKKL